LEVWQTIQAQRERIWKHYDQHLRNWALERGVGCPVVPAHCEQSHHMYYLVMPSLEKRQALISFLKSRGILSVFHYVPLHLSPMGQRMGGRNGSCPVSEQKSERLIRLPFYNRLSPGDQDRVIAAVRQFQP
jgi:dTDP-4-amino-4,6-dideoxygalactose transaminase